MSCPTCGSEPFRGTSQPAMRSTNKNRLLDAAIALQKEARKKKERKPMSEKTKNALAIFGGTLLIAICALTLGFTWDLMSQPVRAGVSTATVALIAGFWGGAAVLRGWS